MVYLNKQSTREEIVEAVERWRQELLSVTVAGDYSLSHKEPDIAKHLVFSALIELGVILDDSRH